MKATGMTRPIDDLGRVVLPKEMRKAMGWNEGDRIEFFTSDDKVVIRKYQPGCVFCGLVEDVTQYMGVNVCRAHHPGKKG